MFRLALNLCLKGCQSFLRRSLLLQFGLRWDRGDRAFATIKDDPLMEQIMVKVTIEEISQNVMDYLHRVQAGESFIVVKAGIPIAQLNPTSNIAKPTIATAVSTFREKMLAENLEIDSDEIWGDVRDCTSVADQPRW